MEKFVFYHHVAAAAAAAAVVDDALSVFLAVQVCDLSQLMSNHPACPPPPPALFLDHKLGTQSVSVNPPPQTFATFA